MALPLIFPDEDAETIYARLIADLPAPAGGGVYNTRAGSIIHAILQPVVVELMRFNSYVYDVASNGFLLYATGTALDDKVTEFGISRRQATASSVVLVVTGDEAVTIPAGAVFSTVGDDDNPGVEFYTMVEGTISAGTASIASLSTDAGAHTNVDPDTIVLIVSSLEGVTSITNTEAAEGGTDVESDVDLRIEALARAASLPFAGNRATYEILGLRNTLVGGVNVDDLWRGAGSGRVVLSGVPTVHVPPDVVDGIQIQFDPSVKTLAHFEGTEVWSGTDYAVVTTTPLEGEQSIELNTVTGTATVFTTLTKNLDLSAWTTSTDTVEISVQSTTPTGRINDFSITFTDAAAVTAVATWDGATDIDPFAGAETVLAKPLSGMTVGGGFSWSTITSVKLTLISAATGQAKLIVDGLRIYDSDGGHGTGEAPIGIQITVVSAKPTIINVDAVIYAADGVELADITNGLEEAIKLAINSLPVSTSSLRLSYIGNVIYDFSGVLDYNTVKIGRAGSSTAAANLSLLEHERPVAGTITLTAG